MLLSILIPTYNRANSIDFNISLLETYIHKNHLREMVNVIVSNNCSSDNTRDIIQKHKNQNVIEILYFEQKTNVGLEKNALFVLDVATTKYVMYLGDDDYLQEEYLLEVLNSLKKYPNIGCIIPNNIAVDANRNIIENSLRETNIKTTLYDNGFNACLANAWRGHQMSALVLYREGLYDAYQKNNVHNLYPFIYFVSFNSLRMDVLHLVDYPVKITVVEQNKKDWNYGNTGLLIDIFDNFYRLKLTDYQRGQLERSIIVRNEWRYLRQPSQKDINKAIESIVFNRRTSYNGKDFICDHVITCHQYTAYTLKFLAPLYKFIRKVVNRIGL